MKASVPKFQRHREPHTLALRGDRSRGIRWGLWGSAPATLKGPFLLQTMASLHLKNKKAFSMLERSQFLC